jgi:hypothetical protein
MISAKKRSEQPAVDSDLASLISSIKKNVGGPSASSAHMAKPVKEKSSSKSDSKGKGKRKSTELEAEPRKTEKSRKPKEQRVTKPIEVDSDEDDLPKVAKASKKRAREEMLPDVEQRDAEEWDNEFEQSDATGREIDDIFGTLKTTKEAKKAAEKHKQEEDEALQRLLQRAAQNSANSSVALRTANAKKDPNRRYTEDGLPIYTTSELGLSNKGGDTDLCPFDCDCCF